MKQPIQAAWLETGDWSCCADSKQTPFFLALSYTELPGVCLGVTHTSVNQQTWDFSAPITRLGSTTLRSCLEVYVPYIKVIDKCMSICLPIATADKYVGILFPFPCKMGVGFKETFYASPSAHMPAPSCRFSDACSDSPLPIGRVPACHSKSQTAPLPWVPTMEGFCCEPPRTNLSRAGAVIVPKMRYGSSANVLSEMPGRKIKET